MEELIHRLSKFQKPDLDNVKEITSAEYYYDPYSHITMHEQIVNDFETVETYKGWIEDNKQIIKDKIVLDVGCGTGLLSMMAAKAGAAHVIGLEWSNIVDYTKQIVKDNNFEKVITVVKGRVEKIKLPYNIKKVDVIISLWMGHSLFQGGRLKAVIHARDKWLKKDGFIIPDRAFLYISGVADDDYRERNIEWWKNVYGYDMSCVTEDALKYAYYCVMPVNKICTNKCEIKKINLKVDSYLQIIAEVPFQMRAKWNDYLQGFCTYFTVKFSADNKREINTDPLLPPKMWGQSVFFFKDYIMIKKKEKLRGSFSFFHINDDFRFLGVILGVFFEGAMDKSIKMKEFILKS